MHICTIIARNYLPAARVLARVVPGAQPGRNLLDAGDRRPGRRGRSGGRAVRGRAARAARDRAVAPDDRGYNVLELSTAVKPWLLRYLLNEQGVERVAYLDPDIQVFDSRAGGGRPAARAPAGGQPAPHRARCRATATSPPRPTSSWPARSTSASPASPPARRPTSCWPGGPSAWPPTACVAPERGYFVDQRWMDFAPGLVEGLFILRDPGYNVAYWNLAGRDLRKRGNRYEVDGRPLRFFHFSGFDPAAPAPPVQAPGPHPVERAAGAARAHAATTPRRSSARGTPSGPARPYGFDALPDGTPLDNVARRGLPRCGEQRRATRRGHLHRAGLPRVPGLPERAGAVGGGAGITRYLAAAAGVAAGPAAGLSRPRRPRRQPADRLGAGVRERHGTVPPALLPLGAGDSADAGHLVPGVNVAGYFKAVLGVGEHARQLVAGLESQGIPVRPITLRPRASPEDAELGGARHDRARGRLSTCSASTPTCSRPCSPTSGGPASSAAATRSATGRGRSVAFPRELARRLRARRRGVGGQRARGTTRWRPSPRCRSCTIPQPVSLPERSRSLGAAELGLPEGFLLPVLLRLQQRVRAQEPARRRRGVHARVRAGRRARRWSIKSHQRTSTIPSAHERLRRRPRPAPGRAPDRPLRARAGERDAHDRRLRLLRVAAPRRGLRLHDGRGDVAAASR